MLCRDVVSVREDDIGNKRIQAGDIMPLCDG